MSQLTIYLDPETQRKVEMAARRESLSLSRWAREHLAKAAETAEASAWDHMAAFAGTTDEPFEIPLRDPHHREISNLES
ncbi:MAG: hypothetical protein ABI600_02580 [Luteolibacter sp.]